MILLINSEGKRLLGRDRCKQEDGIIMVVKEVEFGECGLDSTGSV
jgi:hypothetical protein